ncbi:MAG: hypothetical protein PHI74_01290 [Methanocellales archaeon]|nr:hypothetical protein [Methanocellales archaeon]MDD5484653.1 hypothetical protein [Methanocellales archaeon]
MTDVDIKKALGKDIVIEPFSGRSLTPVGYDFRVGDFLFSLEHGLLEPKEGVYLLPPKSTVQIMSKESLWVSNRIGGTFHSKVSLVSKGLSHISTTLDPGWYGPLLITVRNNLDKEIPIKTMDPFVTLVFFKVSTPTKTPHLKPEFRRDILCSQLNNQTEAYIRKVSTLLDDKKILAKFESKVREANRPMILKVLESARSKGWREVISSIVVWTIYIAIAGLVALPIYWDTIKELFYNSSYDSRVFVVQITAIVSLVSLIVNIRRR